MLNIDNLIEEDSIVLDIKENTKIKIEKQKFEVMFVDCSTYEDYASSQNCTPAWKKIFDKWKVEGRFS